VGCPPADPQKQGAGPGGGHGNDADTAPRCGRSLPAECERPSPGPRRAPPDDEQARWSRPLLPDETRSLRRAARPAAHCSLGRRPAAEGCRDPSAAGLSQRRSELWTGTIGARRAWTVSMISALSMPCRRVPAALVCRRSRGPDHRPQHRPPRDAPSEAVVRRRGARASQDLHDRSRPAPVSSQLVRPCQTVQHVGAANRA
jgi:hypothetical protein